MPGSPTTPGHPSACVDALGHMAFRYTDSVGTREQFSIAAQWLACTLPCRRFADILADGSARLGADVVRYSFIAVDSHHLLLAGLPAHLCENSSAKQFRGSSHPWRGRKNATIAVLARRPFAVERRQRVFTQPRPGAAVGDGLLSDGHPRTSNRQSFGNEALRVGQATIGTSGAEGCHRWSSSTHRQFNRGAARGQLLPESAWKSSG